jgi:hypothetical protein
MYASSDSPSPSSITFTPTSTPTSNEFHSVAKSVKSTPGATPSAESISTPIPNEYNSVEESNKTSLDALNPFKYELFVKIAVIALCLWNHANNNPEKDTSDIIRENETFKIVCEVLKKYNINVNENLFSYVFLALVFVCIDDNSLKISLKEFHAMVPGLKLEETGLVHFLHEFSKHILDEIIKQALQRQASLNLQRATASSNTAPLSDKPDTRVPRISIRNATFPPGRRVVGGGSRKTYRKLKRSKRIKSNKRTLNFKFKSNKRTNKTSKRYNQTGGTAEEVLKKLVLKIFPDKRGPDKRSPLLNSLIMCFMTVLLLWSAFSLFNNLSKLISQFTSTSFSEEENATGNAVRELSDQQLQVFGPHAQEFVGLVDGSLVAILDSEISVTIGNVLAKLFGMGGQSFKTELQHLTGLISNEEFKQLCKHLGNSFELTTNGISAEFANTPRRTGDGVIFNLDNKIGDFKYNLLNTQQISNTALQLAVADNEEAIRRMLEDLKQMLGIRLKRFTTEKRRALYGSCVALMMLGVSSREIYQWVMLSLELKARRKRRGSFGTNLIVQSRSRSSSPPPAADQNKTNQQTNQQTHRPPFLDRLKLNIAPPPTRFLEMNTSKPNPNPNPKVTNRAASPPPH